MKTVFSIQNALVFQNNDLAMWEKILKPEVFDEVRRLTLDQNSLAITGYDICRGNDILQHILNYGNRLRS